MIAIPADRTQEYGSDQANISSSEYPPQRNRIRAQPYRTAPHALALLLQCYYRDSPSLPAFIGRTVFLCTVPLPLLSVVIRLAQRKPPSSSDFKERSWGKVSWKLLQCITVEAYKVGDYESYFRLTHSAPAAAPSLAEYSKGSTSLCGGSPCGPSSPVEWATAEMPGAVSLRPALTPGLRLNPLPPFV